MPSAPFLALAAAQKIQRGVAGLSALSAASAAGGVATMSLMNRVTGYRKRQAAFRQARIQQGRARMNRRVPTSLYLRGVHYFKRSSRITYELIPSTGLGGNGFGLSMGFSLANIFAQVGSVANVTVTPGYTDMTNLFDMWRIDKVVVKAYFQNNGSTTASVTTGMPIMQYALDYNDVSPPGGNNVLTEDGNMRTYQFGNGNSAGGAFLLSLVPRAHLGTGENTTAGGTAGQRPEKPKTWIDTATPSVMHYGWKAYIDVQGATQATTEGQLTFYIDVFYACKDQN